MVKINNPPSVHAEDHAARHSDGGADEVPIENLATAGAAGTAPVSDGAGAVAMTDVETAAEAATHEGNATIHQDAPGLIATHAADAVAHQALGLTLGGSNTTETTTTSTSAVDLFTIGSLNIAAATPFLFGVNVRKSAGSGLTSSFGLKVNSVVVDEPSGSANDLMDMNASTEQNSALLAYIGPRVTNYLRAGGRFSGGSLLGNQSNWRIDVADIPTAVITGLIIRAISSNADTTLAADEGFAWPLPVS